MKTNSAVVTWLYRAWKAQDEIRQLEEQLKRAETKAGSVTSAPDAVVVGGTKDPHKLDEVAALAAQTQRFIRKRVGIIAEINETIEKLDGPQHVNERQLLRKRLIDCKGWKRISYEMNYTDRQCRRIYRRAIDNITPIVREKMTAK